MQFDLQDYRLVLLDDPRPRDCIAFEKASRQFRNETVKPILNDAMARLKDIDIAQASEDNQLLVKALMLVSQSLRSALEIINNNETLTSTSDAVLVTRAALESGWLISCYKGGEPVFSKSSIVEDVRPPWLLEWVSRTILGEYVKAMTIPKN